MNRNISELYAAWKNLDVKSTINIINSIEPTKFGENTEFCFIRQSINVFKGDPICDIHLEILRLYLNKRAEYVPYNVNDAIIKRIEEDYLLVNEEESLCKQVEISACSRDQKMKLIKTLELYLKKHERPEYSEIVKFLVKIRTEFHPYSDIPTR